MANFFTTPTAMRSMMAVEDAEARYPCAFPRVCSAGEPPNAAMMDEEGCIWLHRRNGA